MLKCSFCGKIKEEHEFALKSGSARGYNSKCKECHRSYVKEHYKNNKPKYLVRAKKHREKQKTKLKAIVKDYLLNHPCIDCGESRLPCLDFDHVSGEKIRDISKMVHYGWAIQTLTEEMKKCEVRCANCHRMRHYNENGLVK